MNTHRVTVTPHHRVYPPQRPICATEQQCDAPAQTKFKLASLNGSAWTSHRCGPLPSRQFLKNSMEEAIDTAEPVKPKLSGTTRKGDLARLRRIPKIRSVQSDRNGTTETNVLDQIMHVQVQCRLHACLRPNLLCLHAPLASPFRSPRR